MKKTINIGLIVSLMLLACLMLFTACTKEYVTQPLDDAEDTTKEIEETTKEQHTHTFGEWITTKEPSYTEEGISERYCACGEKQITAIAKKTPQVITLTAENFWDYFNGTYEYVYDEYYGGKVFNYGTIDVVIVCVQAVNGDLENVTVQLALYPRGGRWDVTNFEEDDRLVDIVIPVTTGTGTGSTHMGFSTTQSLSSSDVRKPDTIDIEIVSVTGTITIYP